MNDTDRHQFIVIVEQGASITITPNLCREMIGHAAHSRSENIPCVVCGRHATRRGVFYANEATHARLRQIWSLKRLPWTVIGLCDEHNSYREAETIAREFHAVVASLHHSIGN